MSGSFGSPRSGNGLVFLALGVLVLLFDGYDLFVFGAVAPAMLEYEAWEVTPVMIGLIGSITTLGMPFGAISAGYAADVYGRRLPMMVSLTWISACMFASFVAPSLSFFMATRFAAGLGLGALVPLTIAFVNDWAPEGRRAFYTGTALTGIAFGGLIASFTGRALLPEVHFQWLFFFGCIPLGLVPVVWRLLPDSLPAREPAMAGELSLTDQETSKVRQLFAPGFTRGTIAFWAATFLGLVLVYGASNWLPTLMVNAGYDIRSSLEFAVSFNIGAILGTLLATLIADRGSLKLVTIVSFGLAAVSMFVLSTPQPRIFLLLMAAVAGLGALGTQNLINAYVAQFYPSRVRGTALGFSLGVGRLGAIVGPSYLAAVTVLIANPDAGFYAFMIPALLGALVIAMVPFRSPATPGSANQSGHLKESELR